VTISVCPPTARVPDRGTADTFGEAEKPIVAGPFPDAVEVRDSHAAEDAAVHEQPSPADSRTLADPPAAGIE
jgi:hypothetical protein